MKYRCAVCGATKETVMPTIGRPYAPPPEWVACGYRGCEGRAEPDRS